MRILEAFCERHPEMKKTLLTDGRPNSRLGLDAIRLDTRHRILMCTNPKAGSRFWKRTLLYSFEESANVTFDRANVTHLKEELRAFGLESLKEHLTHNPEQTFKSFARVITVRHPMTRVLSAYRDKFSNNVYGRGSQLTYKYVMTKYRGVPTDKVSRNFTRMNPIITLPEFVRAIVDKNAPFNLHWDTYLNNCNPCLMDFNYVFKLETTNDFDINAYLALISPNYTMPESNSTRMELNSNQILSDFKSVPTSDMAKLAAHYRRDMDMFGYEFNTETLKADYYITTPHSERSCC